MTLRLEVTKELGQVSFSRLQRELDFACVTFACLGSFDRNSIMHENVVSEFEKEKHLSYVQDEIALLLKQKASLCVPQIGCTC